MVHAPWHGPFSVLVCRKTGPAMQVALAELFDFAVGCAIIIRYENGLKPFAEFTKVEPCRSGTILKRKDHY